jgi:hypothetical protein
MGSSPGRFARSSNQKLSGPIKGTYVATYAEETAAAGH